MCTCIISSCLFFPLSAMTLSEDVLTNIPANCGRPTRSSTCLHLRLPKGICCEPCLIYYDGVSMNQNKKRGTGPKRICECPWDERWRSHRHEVKRKRFSDALDYLVVDSDHDDNYPDNNVSVPVAEPLSKKQKRLAPSCRFIVYNTISEISLLYYYSIDHAVCTSLRICVDSYVP
jgi:hypothetical protein